MNAAELIAFEAEVATAFEKGRIHAPVHLSGGNEDQLIRIFKDVKPEDWVFSTWRSHYHALLKGIPRAEVMKQILEGRSMFISSKEHNFYSSSMVAGCLPIACGVAHEHKVWCFVGDMAASIGAFKDAVKFAAHRALPITFVVEDNGLSTNTPTEQAWGPVATTPDIRRYVYHRTYPHYASKKSRHDHGKF